MWNTIVETVTTESIEKNTVCNLTMERLHIYYYCIHTSQIDTYLAKNTMKLFKDAGAFYLMKKSPTLREKAERVLDYSAD